jgi:hypothetical protein
MSSRVLRHRSQAASRVSSKSMSSPKRKSRHPQRWSLRTIASAAEDGGGEGEGAADAVDVTFVLPGPAGAEEEDVTEVRCRASPGENILAAAMRCGAIDTNASTHFCLEGRCDSCLMEDVDGGEEPVRACQEAVPSDGRKTMRLWVGGGGGGEGEWGDDDDFWDAGDEEEEEKEEEEGEEEGEEEEEIAVTPISTSGEEEEEEERKEGASEYEDPDDPFSDMRGGGNKSVWGVAAGDPQEWETFEGSKYYRE